MAKLIWSEFLIPDLGTSAVDLFDESYGQNVGRTRKVAAESSALAIPDPKAFRSMSRASVFISHLAMKGAEIIKQQLGESPFSLGIYCAVENGPIDAPSTKKIISQVEPEKFADNYRKFRNPKMYLKQLPNLVPAQLGISFGLQGPMNVYTHQKAACLHAFDQADWDLRSGVVKAALVCSAHAFDDFLVVKRTRAFDDRILNEGAACALLINDSEIWNYKDQIQKDSDNFFGIADPLINLLRKG